MPDCKKAINPSALFIKQRTLEQIAKPGMIYPSKQATEVALSRNASMLAGIEGLFKKYNVTGYEERLMRK